MRRRVDRSRNAFTLAEALVALLLAVVLIGIAIWLVFYGGRANERIGRELALQQQSRQAIARLLEELQEGMELLSPRPGSTQPWALIRDRMGRVRMYYQRPSRSGGNELARLVEDPEIPPGERVSTLLARVKRVRFTSRGAGSVRVDLTLAEGGEERALVFSVRLRNVAAAEELW